jgi:hypothetical protein
MTAKKPTTVAGWVPMSERKILSLCDFTGTWSEPYRAAGYDVIQVDIKAGDDVRLFEYPGKVHGILAAPPCTHFAGSGARWWEGKGDDAILEGMAIVDACLRFVAVCKPVWWVLENPVGRLPRWIGDWRMTFQPWEYATLADDPEDEAYTKRTCLFGEFNEPIKAPHPKGAIHGSKMWKLPPSEERAALRSVTPQGFARAFFKANP